jgi:hypothetical protein
MKKEIVLLNELNFLFTDDTREFSLGLSKGKHTSSLLIEIDYTDHELKRVRDIIKDTLIDDFGMVLNVPLINSNELKRFSIIMVPKDRMGEMDLSQNYL